MTQYIVGRVSEIPQGTNKLLEVEGRSIGVYNLGGQFYALRNVCPHRGAELCKGLTKPLVVSSGPGDFSFEREGEILRCPWHQWEFDIKTGHMVLDPAMHTKCYEVTVEKVEQFDVTVEDEQIIIHM